MNFLEWGQVSGFCDSGNEIPIPTKWGNLTKGAEERFRLMSLAIWQIWFVP
jgi:hypothetical protein